MNMKRVSVVGAGTMGSRIAFQCVLCDKEVMLYDLSPEALEQGKGRIREWLQGKADPGMAELAQARLKTCATLAECVSEADLVIENVPEDLALKREVFADLDDLAPEKTLFATNSSSIPSSQLAEVTGRPEKVFNLNFHDPVGGLYAVEVMRHPLVTDQTLDRIQQFLLEIKTVPIVTEKEIMGFSFNRVWRSIKRESLHLVGDGYSNFEDLDRCWLLLFGGELAPFILMDKIGLDVVRDIEMEYYRDSQEERDKPPAFLDRLIEEGRLGVKSGRGFYSYPDPVFEQPGWLTKETPWTPGQAVKLDI